MYVCMYIQPWVPDRMDLETPKDVASGLPPLRETRQCDSAPGRCCALRHLELHRAIGFRIQGLGFTVM